MSKDIAANEFMNDLAEQIHADAAVSKDGCYDGNLIQQFLG